MNETNVLIQFMNNVHSKCHTFSLAQANAKLYISRNFSVWSEQVCDRQMKPFITSLSLGWTSCLCKHLYSNDICATLAAVEPKKENLRSSLSSARNEGNFSRSFSIESTLKMSQIFWNYSIYLHFRISSCSTNDYKNRTDQSHPIDCSPPMNSWRVNSHIVEAFICHDMTSC